MMMMMDDDARGDVIQNMIVVNRVPDEFIAALSSFVISSESTIPPECKNIVKRNLDYALAHGDASMRFFALITGVHHCPAVRALVTTSTNKLQVDWWATRCIPQAWDRFFLGRDKTGRAGCTTAFDAMYGNILDFVALLQTEYISIGWNL